MKVNSSVSNYDYKVNDLVFCKAFHSCLIKLDLSTFELQSKQLQFLSEVKTIDNLILSKVRNKVRDK
jgi:hypothetical protein